MDEIDRCVNEVNALLGPPMPATTSQEDNRVTPAMALLLIEKKYLDPANELRRLFGADPGENRK